MKETIIPVEAAPMAPGGFTNEQYQTLKGYSVALGLTLLAVLARLALDPFLDDHLPYVTFFTAVAVSIWYCSLGASLTAVVLGGLASSWFFIAPRHSFMLAGAMHHVGHATFFIVSLSIVGFGQAWRLSSKRAELAIENLRCEVSERKQAEQSMHEAQGHLAAIVTSSVEAIMSKSLNGTVTTWNDGAAGVFGYTASEMIGQPIRRLIPRDRQEEEEDILAHIAIGGSIEQYDTIRLHKDGRRIDVSVTISPIRDGTGMVTGAATVIRDITHRRQIEQALRENEQRLQGWNVELEKAVNAKTADLKKSQERLRALATELNLAEQRERKRLAAELHDHLQQILVLGKLKLGQAKRYVESVPQCAQVIRQTDDVLSEALKYTRTLVTELSPQVLHDHGLSAGLKWLAESMKKLDLVVAVSMPEDNGLKLPEDQTVLLFQSVRELLVNSLKHAGTHEASISLEVCDEQLTIEVKDLGAGFDLAVVAGEIPSEPTDGISSKFGLFSIRERMKALGGAFNIQSALGGGTTATLKLPFSVSTQSTILQSTFDGLPHPLADSASIRPSPRIRVLIVDDHAMMRQGLRSILASNPNIEIVAEAADGIEALSRVEQHRPAIVVIDINMPNMNGIEATARLTARYPGIHVIGLSVNAGGENQEAMRRAGATILLTKEAAVEHLYEAIQSAMKSQIADNTVKASAT